MTKKTMNLSIAMKSANEIIENMIINIPQKMLVANSVLASARRAARAASCGVRYSLGIGVAGALRAGAVNPPVSHDAKTMTAQRASIPITNPIQSGICVYSL